MNTTFSAVARVLRLECLLGENNNKYKVISVPQLSWQFIGTICCTGKYIDSSAQLVQED